MRTGQISIISVVGLLWLSSSLCLADEDEGGTAKIGPDQAITKVNPELGFQLSPAAQKRLEIATTLVQGTGPVSISKKALVKFQDETGIYRLRDQWFKLIHVQIISKTDTKAVIRSNGLSSSDQIVTSGVPLLRVSDMEASGGGEEAHE